MRVEVTRSLERTEEAVGREPPRDSKVKENGLEHYLYLHECFAEVWASGKP